MLVLSVSAGCVVEKEPASNDVAAGSGRTMTVPLRFEPALPEESKACAPCHAEHYDLWKEGGHKLVSCVTCHGPAGNHSMKEISPRPRMKLRSRPDLCVCCHGRGRKIGSIEVPEIGGFDDHVSFIGKKHSVSIDTAKIGGRCIFCHDPHSLE